MNPDEAAASLALVNNLQKQLLMQGRQEQPSGEMAMGESMEEPMGEPMGEPEGAPEQPVEPGGAPEEKMMEDMPHEEKGAEMGEIKEIVSSQIDELKTEVKDMVKGEIEGLAKVIKDALNS